jgi:hypothetical protein
MNENIQKLFGEQSILDWDKADQVVARIKEHFGVTE